MLVPLGLVSILSGSLTPLPVPNVTEPAPPAVEPFGLLTPFVTEAQPLPSPGAVDPNALPSESDSEYAPNLYRRFAVSAGVAAYDNFNTNLRVSGQAGIGASVDFEDLLGVSHEDTILRFDSHYSFNRRNRIDLSYYDLRRSGTATIPNDIQVGDVVIPAGTTESFFNTKIIKLAYRYNFVTDYRTVIGASLGAHVMNMDIGISNPNFAVEEQFKASAPLPLLGLHAAYALSDHWSLNGSVEVLQFDVQDYRGFISDTLLTIENDTFEHFGWGVGFNGFRIDGSIDGRDNLTADLEYGYQGLMLYLRCYF